MVIQADGGAGNAPGGEPAAALPAGQAARQVAIAQLGKPYVYGTRGPNTFDCSGLMEYCYLHGPGFDIGGDTNAQWGNNTNLKTICDVTSNQSPISAITGLAGGNSGIPNMVSESDLQIGDMLYYFVPGSGGGANAHVMMYVGGSQCIEAPHTGDVVKYTGLTFGAVSSTEPFRGVKRPNLGNVSGTTDNGSSSGSGSSGSSGTNTQLTADQQAQMVKDMNALKDPRTNLPFSAYFQGQIVGTGVTASGPNVNFNSGSLQVPPFGSAPTLFPATKLVRGGMGELITGQFKCYFMMNPEQISVTTGINTSQLSPFLQDPTQLWQSGGYGVSNQTVTFTIYFNRMYEVWQGNIHNPNGGPGPSDEGCRWDTRALERLMGVFDAVANNGQDTGLGNNGWGGNAASMIPLQIVFGGKNALRFQGVMAGFDYTFTLFDANMIPVEAYADISVMRVYNPNASSPDVVNSLVTTTGQVGPQNLPNANSPFTQ